MKKFVLYLFFLICFIPKIFAIDVGQFFILTLPSDIKLEEIRSWLSQAKPAGVMLTSPHFSSTDFTRQLTQKLQDEARALNLPPLFIAVDWEGGIVSRPSEVGGFYSVPSPRNICLGTRELEMAGLAGALIGRQLSDVGVNMNFAPSLDLFAPLNFILATRCFSDNPQTTAEFGIKFAESLKWQGVFPVVKHFPGLGLGKGDTHNQGVSIEFDLQNFTKHTFPFMKAIQAGIPFVMVSHAQCSIFGGMPATLSPEAVSWIRRINKNVLLICDDFCMSGVKVDDSLPKTALKAILAGYNLIIFSAPSDQQIKVIEELQSMVDSLDKVDEFALLESVKMTNSFKEKNIPAASRIDFCVSQELACKMLAESSILFNKEVKIQKDSNLFLLTINLPLIRQAEQWFIQENLSYLARKLSQNNQVQEFLFDPIQDFNGFEMPEIQECDYFIVQTFFYGGGKWNDFQIKLLEKLRDVSNLIVVSLGHPLERAILEEKSDVAIFELGSFHIPLLNALANKLTLN